jgi:hypothetical protein
VRQLCGSDDECDGTAKHAKSGLTKSTIAAASRPKRTERSESRSRAPERRMAASVSARANPRYGPHSPASEVQHVRIACTPAAKTTPHTAPSTRGFSVAQRKRQHHPRHDTVLRIDPHLQTLTHGDRATRRRCLRRSRRPRRLQTRTGMKDCVHGGFRSQRTPPGRVRSGVTRETLHTSSTRN